MNTIFYQIDNRNFAPDARHEFTGVDSTPRTNGKADGQNLITRTGAATLAAFIVAFAQNTVYSFAHKPQNQTQGRRLQLNKILYS